MMVSQFLSTYSDPEDPRVTKLIRNKARVLRKSLMTKNERVEALRTTAMDEEAIDEYSSSSRGW